MKYSVIITAGGIGKRMNHDLPKQFIPIHGMPVLMHTIKNFYNYDPRFQIVVTLPKEHIQFWEELCEKHEFKIQHKVCEGGKERYHSVKNALGFVDGEIVMIHDAVRPLVNNKTIKQVIEKAEIMEAAIPVLPLKETLRKGTKENNQHLDRSSFWTVQTPQAFKSEVLKEAYKSPFNETITDDASLVEKVGKQIFLTEGNEENIKITTPYDLKLAEFLLERV